MAGAIDLALKALGEIQSGSGYSTLSKPQRAEMDRHLERIRTALEGGGKRDAYAQLLGTPADLQRELGGPQPTNGAQNGAPTAQAPAPAAPAVAPPAPAAPPGTADIGNRASDALEAVNFPGFVAALVKGTFDAIV